MTARRWPVAPLLVDRTVTTLAAMVGVSRRTVHSRMHAGLDDATADRWATACGMHALEVWPAWADVDVDELPAQHGERARYGAGCRCARCVDANRTYQRAYRRRRLARGHERIVRGRFVRSMP